MIPETGKRDYSISQRNSDSGVIAQITFQFTMVYYYYFSRRSKILLLRGGLLFIVYCSLLLLYKTATYKTNIKCKCF